MNNLRLTLKDDVVILLTQYPESLDMREFSKRLLRIKRSKSRKNDLIDRAATYCGTTFCLAGAILVAAKVKLKFDRYGIARGLGPAEIPPSADWIDHERKISALPIEPSKVILPAKARNTWAEAYGAVAARHLPFYAADWGQPLDEVTVEQVIDFLQIVNRIIV